MLPYKPKHRAGRHVAGQRSYDPCLDANNWAKDSLNMHSGSLNPQALATALLMSENKPRFLTKIGKLRIRQREQELFPDSKLQKSHDFPNGLPALTSGVTEFVENFNDSIVNFSPRQKYKNYAQAASVNYNSSIPAISSVRSSMQEI